MGNVGMASSGDDTTVVSAESEGPIKPSVWSSQSPANGKDGMVETRALIRISFQLPRLAPPFRSVP
jgi:hypothetical protein